jgi:hypothetical protein
MSTYRDEDGSYRSITDPYTPFGNEYEAARHEQARLTPSPYLGPHIPEPSENTYDSSSYEGITHTSNPDYVAVKGDTKIDIWVKPFIVLWAYWFLAFPAINAAWLLRTAGFPFSWFGTVLYYPWTFLVKAIGAPYYLAYMFNGVGQAIAMAVIAVIWFFALSYACNRLWETKPQLLNKVLKVLAIAAVIPVALTILAYMTGSLSGDIVQNFWFGHDPYTYVVRHFFNFPNPGYGLPAE